MTKNETIKLFFKEYKYTDWCTAISIERVDKLRPRSQTWPRRNICSLWQCY